MSLMPVTGDDRRAGFAKSEDHGSSAHSPYAMEQSEFLKEPLDFSLVLGGPTFQLFRKSHQVGDDLELLHRRLAIITSIVWLPLLFLTMFVPSAGAAGRFSFLRDVEVHARFLIALPVLIAAELIVHSRIRPVVRRFVEGRLVLPADLPRFQRAVESAVRLRNSIPDRCAGLAFLGKSAYAFGPIVFAQGAMLAGLVASRVLYRGEGLLSFKLQIGGFIVFFIFGILGPLLMFTPRMARTKRKGLADYGLLAQRYVESFDRKWVLRDAYTPEELLGAGDIQSLADLGNSYALVRDMRAVPFGLEDITRLAAATAAPLVPLLLTIFSPEELVLRVIKVVF